MKFIICLVIFTVFSRTISSSKGNQLRIFNLDYVREGESEKKHFAFKYSKMIIECVKNESDVDLSEFKFTWNYSDENEKNQGNSLISEIKKDFLNLNGDNDNFNLIFNGKDLQKLEFYRQNEFGSAYTIKFQQINILIQAQFQIKSHEQYEEEFHAVIAEIINKRTNPGFLKLIE